MTKPTGLRRIINACGYSLDGLRRAWKDEAAFRQECMVLIAGTAVAFWLDIGFAQRAVLIGSLLLILIVELLNTGVEALADYAAGEERHPLVKKAKDTASAAVFVSLIIAILVWLAILWPG